MPDIARNKVVPRANSRPSIILASASPRRRELLKNVVAEFAVVPSGLDEEPFREQDPAAFALKAASAKARAVGESFPDSLVIAADTLVCLGREVFGKPAGHADARSMLQKLSGKRHRVITAVALFRKNIGLLTTAAETTWVTFKPLSGEAIDDYLGKNEYLDKAGSYAIQESEAALIERVEGDYDNVVGLPVRLLRNLLAASESGVAQGPGSNRPAGR